LRAVAHGRVGFVAARPWRARHRLLWSWPARLDRSARGSSGRHFLPPRCARWSAGWSWLWKKFQVSRALMLRLMPSSARLAQGLGEGEEPAPAPKSGARSACVECPHARHAPRAPDSRERPPWRNPPFGRFGAEGGAKLTPGRKPTLGVSSPGCALL
jgi:hypothetical protein